MKKQDILAALRGFISQRSGIDSRNYFYDWRDATGVAEFRADYRRILKQGRHARELLRVIEQRESITVEDILLRSKGGRLEITERDGRVSVHYCAGQYYATEYRAAACAFLADIIWRRIFADLAEGGKEVTGDDIRKRARVMFGRSIASAWFS